MSSHRKPICLICGGPGGRLKSKSGGFEVVTRPAVDEPGKVVDLMAALEKSLSVAREEVKGESGKGSAS